MAERRAKAWRRRLVLVRAPGLRVPRPGAILAVVAPGRIVFVAGADGPRVVAGLEAARRERLFADPVPYQQPSDCGVLRRGAGNMAADTPDHGRILALVGGAPLGRVLF